MSSITHVPAAPARRDLYIYYQVPEAALSQAAACVRAIQAALGRGELKRRPGAEDGRVTLMEIYLDTDDGFAAALERRVQAHGLTALLAGARHTEVFTNLPVTESLPCA